MAFGVVCLGRPNVGVATAVAAGFTAAPGKEKPVVLLGTLKGIGYCPVVAAGGLVETTLKPVKFF